MGKLTLILLAGAAVVMAVAGLILLQPASGKRFLIISAPPEAVLPHLMDPDRLKAWVPQALGIPRARFEVVGEGSGAHLVWRSGEGLGQVQAEPARVDRAARLRLVAGDGSERIWRFRFGDAGRYGLALTVFTVYRPAGVLDRLDGFLKREDRARALERGLSLLRGRVLADFGQAGGSYRPPERHGRTGPDRVGALDTAQPLRAN
ncbi:MAG: SRPBCC family protein [Alphaproteobacteria bacterium]